jgi:quercetin dioxygenase-like cupin family protein
MAATAAQPAANAQAKGKPGADVHRCFEKALADRLDSAGTVEVTVGVGKGGHVTSVKVKKADKASSPTLSACIEKAALAWTLGGIEPGASVVLPFSFKPQQSQYVVNASDVSERALGAPSSKGKAAAPKRDVPFTVKVLADETNVKAEGVSLTLLSIGPASRVAMHRHPHSAKILYLVKGHARLLGPEGAAPIKLEEGAAVLVPAGYPHVIENMGRQSTAVFLQAFSPPGPERVYRDPTDARGRAEFEVIRDPASVKALADVVVVVATAAEAKSVALARGAGNAKTLIEARPSQPMSFVHMELADGAELQGKGDPSATTILYLVSGTGSVQVGGEKLPLVAESMIYLPRATAYAIKVASADRADKTEKSDKIVMVELRVAASRK